jgi:hypothetical protein
MIDAIDGSQEVKEEMIPCKTRSQKAIKQIFLGENSKNLCRVNRRIFINDSLDLEAEKNDLAEMLV